jgi:hypothetical protein
LNLINTSTIVKKVDLLPLLLITELNESLERNILLKPRSRHALNILLEGLKLIELTIEATQMKEDPGVEVEVRQSTTLV